MDKNKLKNMSRDELENLLNKKQDLYEEVEEERKFVLGQTGRHVPGSLREQYQKELDQIQAQIKQVREVLNEKE